MVELKTTKIIDVRFSEIDAMNVVWHGSYMLYFEDAREAFGDEWGMGYRTFIENRTFAPIVDIQFHYRSSIRYGMKPAIEITYIPCEAAKIIFEYKIFDPDTSTVFVTGKSTQVFMNLNYELIWENPDFYKEWKQKWGLQ